MCTVSSATFPQTYICFYRFHDPASLKDVAGYADPLKYLLPWDLQTQSAITALPPTLWLGDSPQSPLPTYEVFHLSSQLRTESVSKLGCCRLAIALNCCYSLHSGLWSLKIIFLSKLIPFPLGRLSFFPLAESSMAVYHFCSLIWPCLHPSELLLF